MSDERYDFTAESYNERREKELAEKRKQREQEEAEQKKAEEMKARQLQLEREIAEEKDRIDKAHRAKKSARFTTSFLGRNVRRMQRAKSELKRLHGEYKAMQKKHPARKRTTTSHPRKRTKVKRPKARKTTKGKAKQRRSSQDFHNTQLQGFSRKRKRCESRHDSDSIGY
jgi:multidrug efflux pump subunit AcrA (membrane-fusion protein)